jgi:hypothetical protein
MRGVIIRFVLFGLLFMSAGALIKRMLPYCWGNAWYTDKHEALHAMTVPPTIFFFGSSRVYRHLAPTVFDSVLVANGKPMRSFNLGAPGTFPPEAYHLIEGALEAGDLPAGSTVIMELAEPSTVEPHMLRTARSSYHMTPASWWMMMRYFRETRSAGNRWEPMRMSTITLGKNLFHIGQMKAMLGEYDHSAPELDGLDVGGFMSLEREAIDGPVPALSEDIRKRHHELLADTLMLSRQRALVAEARAKPPGAAPAVWRNALNRVEAACAGHGVRLIWFFPPKTISKREWAMLHELGPEKVIDLNDPVAHPEFYVLRYRYDRGHLNSRGARLHTVRLAHRFLGLTQNAAP